MKTLRILNLLLGIYIVIIAAGLVAGQGEFCILVEPCTVDIDNLPIGGLIYDISADTDSFICPRTDVIRWIIRAVVSSSDSTTVDGTYCGVNITFNSSLVCSTGTGRLAFLSPKQFPDENGLFEFNFNSLMYNKSISIKYAKTGVFPQQKVIEIVGNDPIILEYFIYSSTSVSDYILSRNSTVLYQNSGAVSGDVKFSIDTLMCLEAESERTDVYQFRIVNPIPGSYVLKYDIYAAVINVVGSSSVSSSPMFTFLSPSIASFTNLSVPMGSSSITPTTTESMPESTYTSPIDPSSTPSSPLPSPDSQIAAIIGGSVGVIALLIICGIILILVIICYLRCKTVKVKNETLVVPQEEGHPCLNSVKKEGSEEAETEFVNYPDSSTPLHDCVCNGGVTREKPQTHPNQEKPLDRNEESDKQLPLRNMQHANSTPPNIETANGGIMHKEPIDDDKNGKYKMVAATDTQTTQSHSLSTMDGTRGDQECLPTDRAPSTPPSPRVTHHNQPEHEGNLSVEFLNIQKEKLQIDKERLKTEKEQRDLLSELLDTNKTLIKTQKDHHEQKMELEKEQLEVGRDILGTMETAGVSETDSTHEPIRENLTSINATDPLTIESSHQPHQNGKYKMVVVTDTQTTQSHPLSTMAGTRVDQACLPTDRAQLTPPSPRVTHHNQPEHTTEPIPSHQPHPPHTINDVEPCNNLDDSSDLVESNDPSFDANHHDSNAL